MLASVSTLTVVTGLCGALTIVVAVVAVVLLSRPKTLGWSTAKLPFSPSSIYENIRRMQNQRGLIKLKLLYDMFASVKPGEPGRTERGVTFALAMPSFSKFIYTTDYKLARLYLQGDPEKGIIEHEKSNFIKLVNFVNRDVFSIISLKNTDKDREAVKKALAPSFSTQNMYLTWPYLHDALVREFIILRKHARGGELLDCRDNILHFLLRLLGYSAFGVEFTDDGTEGPDSINGVEYLECQRVALSERMKEVSLPFRKYMFWDKNVQAGVRACETQKRMAQKILDLHRAEKKADSNKRREGSKRHVLIEAISDHDYTSEDARLSDINIMAFAGHDTTAYTLCFFLMELGRHPEIRAKLQAEIATVMPKEPLGHHTASVASAAAGADEGAAGPLRHGDQKLLSAICGLDYLNQCIRESMRLWPTTANGSARHLHEDLHWEGMVLPKGSSIRSHNFSMFRESWIDRPLEFRPERWAADSPQLAELKEMFLPFSLGKRACIGQNMAMFQLRIIAAYFLHYFDFTLVGEPDFAMFMTMKPVDLFLSVQERHPFD